jgi:hypothetical protein
LRFIPFITGLKPGVIHILSPMGILRFNFSTFKERLYLFW